MFRENENSVRYYVLYLNLKLSTRPHESANTLTSKKYVFLYCSLLR